MPIYRFYHPVFKQRTLFCGQFVNSQNSIISFNGFTFFWLSIITYTWASGYPLLVSLISEVTFSNNFFYSFESMWEIRNVIDLKCYNIVIYLPKANKDLSTDDCWCTFKAQPAWLHLWLHLFPLFLLKAFFCLFSCLFWKRSETYSEPYQTSKLRRFVKIVNCQKKSTIFAKYSILHVWQGSEYVSLTLFPTKWQRGLNPSSPVQKQLFAKVQQNRCS